MAFKLLLLPPGGDENTLVARDWPQAIRKACPDVEVRVAGSVGEAMEMIDDVDAAFGDIAPELLEMAHNLKWIACPQAGPKAGYYHESLITSDVVVTNTREIYNDHISAHIMSFILAFARGLHVYIPLKNQRQWKPGYEITHLPEATVGIIGVGGIGAETARLCAEFGMTVLAVDPRVSEPPKGVAELHGSDALNDVLPRCDFVVLTVPETPETQGLFNTATLGHMKNTACLINIGRGAVVVLDDLAEALRAGIIGGAALDVFQVEPLPSDHALWTLENVIITPHVAGMGPYLEERRTELFVENCVRFNEGRELKNVVDKANWF
ncbi:MAG: D-2-hydroxyacid dehydrogenase [Chloroflexi bacterium]|nr:D-2-hydroxyacid dehydrogenase [Chloroflexota bacterium]MDA1226977.1 D-2-hydroxyacid dehydrogenase [Chloroflexota bacterium]